jgi:hypothetical protein
LAPTQPTPSTTFENSDQDSVQTAVILWADEVFHHHESYKFEQFRAEYTDDYFVQTSRIELYEEKVADMKAAKANGTYAGSETQYEKDLARFEAAIADAKEKCKTIDPVDHYSIHFWSNIMTDDGITVYYELIVRLNSQYQIESVKENSSIGKKAPTSKITYKKGCEGIRVLEKN